MPEALRHPTRTHARRSGAIVICGVLALMLGTHAVGATRSHPTRACRIVIEHRRLTRHPAPLQTGVVDAHTTRTVRVRVCRMISVGTHPLRHTRLVGHPAPLIPPVHITTATLAAVQLTIPQALADRAPISLGVSLSVSPFDRMSELDSYTAMLGTGPHALMWYRQWNEPLVGGTEIQQTAQRGITPIISWEPQDPANPADPAYALAAIASGAWDTYITQSARRAAQTATPLLINLAPEMNGGWSAWGPGHNGNTPAIFVAAYRHVVDIFRAHGATNVGWIWAPNTDWNAPSVYASYYPGDGYVDWLGMDGYNFGTTTSDGWLTPPQIFGRSYAALVGLAAKPIVIEETASTELGGSKAGWIAQLAQTIPAGFPAVAALVWFQRNKETDWRVNSSPSALGAFQALATRPDWGGPAMAVHPGG
jgi:Glycosyl hydrolase family 26